MKGIKKNTIQKARNTILRGEIASINYKIKLLELEKTKIREQHKKESDV